MVWTYDGDPTGDRKDEVRMMVGDTIESTPLLQDEEIDLILTQAPPVDPKPAWLASALACDAIAGKLARKMQQSIGPLQNSAQQQFEHYREMAQQFRVLFATDGRGIIDGPAGNMIGVKAAAPVLSGGGRTYLGGTIYSTQYEGDGA